MKISIRFFSLSLALIGIGLGACTSTQTIEISCDAFYENPHRVGEVEVVEGDKFSMSLCSNPSTGFQWSEQASIGDQAVVEQVDHEFLGPPEKDQPPPPGTPGTEVWTFHAIASGETTITVEYSRPWEGGEKGEWTYRLAILVK